MHAKDKKWGDLNEMEQKAAVSLGIGDKNWSSRNNILISSLDWSNLSRRQKVAVCTARHGLPCSTLSAALRVRAFSLCVVLTIEIKCACVCCAGSRPGLHR